MTIAAKKQVSRIISPEEFVRAYMDAHQQKKTKKELAASLGLLPGAVGSRARHYRSKGINLPFLKRVGGRPEIDVESLQAIVEARAK